MKIDLSKIQKQLQAQVEKELEERLKQIKDIQNKGVESSKARISGGFRQSFKV